jgi:hypothetical protein
VFAAAGTEQKDVHECSQIGELPRYKAPV